MQQNYLYNLNMVKKPNKIKKCLGELFYYPVPGHFEVEWNTPGKK